MYEVDFARGLAYKGDKGFIIKLCSKGLYIMDGIKMILLTEQNTTILAS